jgi:hypothetical protein
LREILMAEKFRNKRHEELKNKFAGAKGLIKFMEGLAINEVKKSGRSIEEFSRGSLLAIGKDFYDKKIHDYEQGFESGNYLKTDLPYAQRIAHNIHVLDFELYHKR